MIRVSKRRSIGDGYDFSKKYGNKIGAETNRQIGSTPIQVANLSALMTKLQKTGNFAQANEDVLKITQKKKMHRSLLRPI